MVVAVMIMTPSDASAVTPTPVLDDPKAREWGAAASDGYLVWSQWDRKRDYNSFAKADGGPVANLLRHEGGSPSATIDGTTAVVARFRANAHGYLSQDLRLVDVVTGESHAAPAGVNTRSTETDPSLSGDRLLFTRMRDAYRHARVVLFDLATHEQRILASLGLRTHYLAAGQVNGDWVTWESCDRDPDRDVFSNCQAYRYRVSTGETETLPNPGTQQSGAGVSSDGTAYVVRSGWRDVYRCGANVRIVRVLRNGATDVIASLPPRISSGNVFAFEEADGSTTLYLDWFDCEGGGSDIYRIDVPTRPGHPTAARSRSPELVGEGGTVTPTPTSS